MTLSGGVYPQGWGSVASDSFPSPLCAFVPPFPENILRFRHVNAQMGNILLFASVKLLGGELLWCTMWYDNEDNDLQTE